MAIKIVDGDLLQATENIIAHQVNCKLVMGGGVAKQLRDKYDGLFEEYKGYIRAYGSKQVYGKCQLVSVNNDEKIIANLFGQYDFGRENKVYTDYVKLEEALNILKRYAIENQLTVALPWMIGCGLANGDWVIVWNIINKVFSDYEVTLYRFNG